MTTPYDRKILLVNWMGRNTPGDTIADTAALFKQKMPNVGGIMLKVNNGISWQGHLGDTGSKAVTGVRRIAEWVEEFGKKGLDVHVWGVPRGKQASDIAKEADKFVSAATVAGVKSVLLDVEHGDSYWLGSPQQARDLIGLIRKGVGDDFHIGLILDGRRNRPFSVWVDPWIPSIDSLHPMVYPIMFGDFQSIDQHIADAFRNLATYSKPIVPMLQSASEWPRRPSAEEITSQGNIAFAKGAAGISFFRIGSDNWGNDRKPHMGDTEYKAVSKIHIPKPIDEVDIPEYTWQDVINASVTVSSRVHQDWNQWFADAGVWRLFNNALRERPYTGPAIADWPIEKAWINQILELLGLSSSQIALITANEQTKKEQEEKDKQAKERQKKGSIIGVHGAPGVAAPPSDMWDKWIEYFQEMGIRWYKQCDWGDPNDTGPHSVYAWVKKLKEAGIEPIVRYLMSEQFPDTLSDHYFEKMKKFADIGVVWAEIGNEPNLDIEWKSSWHNRQGHEPMRHSNPAAVKAIAEAWVKDARKALNAGVKPGFYAFAPTDWRGGNHPLYSSVFFTQKVVAYLAQHHKQTVIDLFKDGAWIAVHSSTYEQPVDFDPYRPDGTVWDMTLRGYEIVLNAFRDSFGNSLDVDKIVMMSTEGGVFTPDSTSMNGHDRLSSEDAHGKRTVEMFRWLERHSPMKAMCPWCISVGSKIGHFHAPFQHDGWFEEVNGEIRARAVYEAMRQLRFNLEREAEEQDEGLNMIKLNVPYISQFDDTARTHNADCGPTSMAMILNAQPNPKNITVYMIYQRHLPNKQAGDFTFENEMVNIGNGEGVNMRREKYANATEALDKLHSHIEAGTPFVALINYAKWDEIARNNFRGGHFVVVTGFDADHVFVHDPLFRGSRRNEGSFFVWRNKKFLDGWGSGNEIGNPDFAAIIPTKTVSKL